MDFECTVSMNKDCVPVIIETPKGSTEKYAYDDDHRCFKLHKILPSGMVFPYDFGFIPGTKGDDGDPLDVIVFSEYKSFPGCLMDCRIIGGIKAEQISANKKKKERNDRFVAIPALSKTFADIAEMADLAAEKMNELQEFFINYNRQAGKVFKPLGAINSKKAIKLIDSQRK